MHRLIADLGLRVRILPGERIDTHTRQTSRLGLQARPSSRMAGPSFLPYSSPLCARRALDDASLSIMRPSWVPVPDPGSDTEYLDEQVSTPSLRGETAIHYSTQA